MHRATVAFVLFTATAVAGAFVIDVAPFVDGRGMFARTFCEVEFDQHGLVPSFPQSNWSRNIARGTLRGMHYEVAPGDGAKVVRCTNGAIYDVVLDLRPYSNTYRSWSSIELTRENAKALYIPPGCAHGFLTLQDDVDVLYDMGTRYDPASARGVRWDDPDFGIEWPFPPAVISERDASYSDHPN